MKIPSPEMVCEGLGRPFQTFESEEGVANDVFLGLGICGKDDRVPA
jgi:hypothetical protein